MRKILDRFYLLCGILGAITMVSMVMLVIAQIAARFFDTNIPSSDDISGYMTAWATFLGLSYAMKYNDHIRVDLFLNFLSPKIRHWFSLFTTSVALILLSSFLYYVFLAVKESYDFEDMTPGLVAMPLWMIQLPYLLGVFALTVSLLDRLVTILRIPAFQEEDHYKEDFFS